MQAGKLRHKITIQKQTETQDSYGEVDVTWSEYCKTFAQIMTTSGKESYESHQIYGQRTVKFKIRYNSTTKAITPKMRVYWGSRYFDIEDVERANELNKDIFLTTTEIV